MASNRKRLPRSTSSRKIAKAVKKLKAMPMTERVQLLVKANLLSQTEADQAKSNLLESAKLTS